MQSESPNLAPALAADQLRAVGLRVTAPRQAVLQAVHAHPHAGADLIGSLVRAALGNVSTQTIYDCLAALSRSGLLRRIDPPGSAARYETRVGDNHHHLICRQCGSIEDVACTHGAAPCLHASNDHGYAIDEAEVVYWGLCPVCQSAQ